MGSYARKKVVLVNLMDDLHRQYSSDLISQPPLCLGVLFTRTPGTIDVSIMDEQVDPIVWDGDVFAFSVTTQLAKKVYAAADKLRQQGKKVILGGYHVTVCPQEAAGHADTIITGEAESIWPSVCEDVLNDALKPHYLGEPTKVTEMRPIERQAFAGKKYAFPGALYASRGCTFSCSFCASSRILGNYRRKAIDLIRDEVENIHREHGSTILQFTDDNLFADRLWRKEFLHLMRETHSPFVCQMTIDQLCDQDLVNELSESGCLAVATGVETLYDADAKSVNKVQNLNRPIPAAVAYAASKGIHVAALLIVGLEGDTLKKVELSIDRLREIPFSVYDVCMLRPYPGTGLYNEMIRKGTTVPQWWIKPEPYPSNKILPGYLRVYFTHPDISAIGLQRCATKFIASLNHVNATDVLRILMIGMKARNPVFALRILAGRIAVSWRARRWNQDLVKFKNTEQPCAKHERVPLPPLRMVR